MKDYNISISTKIHMVKKKPFMPNINTKKVNLKLP